MAVLLIPFPSFLPSFLPILFPSFPPSLPTSLHPSLPPFLPPTIKFVLEDRIGYTGGSTQAVWVFSQTIKGAATLDFANCHGKGRVGEKAKHQLLNARKLRDNSCHFHLHEVGHYFHYIKHFVWLFFNGILMLITQCSFQCYISLYYY